MTRFTKGSILAVSLSAALACATTSPGTGETKATYKSTQTEVVTANVTAIDLPSRLVSVKEAKGVSFSFVAGDQVKNLDQLKVGDEIKVQYLESLVVEVKKGDGTIPLPTVGPQPEGTPGRQATLSAQVEAIDLENSRVTLKGAGGNSRIVQVQDKAKLNGVIIGNLVVVTMTNPVAISVEKTGAAKP